ncbi:MAG: 30S ribosome-binding factor RbfA [Ignavibacteriaceae bacterium]
MSHRVDKVENLIKEEISLIFLHKMREEFMGFVTITDVKISADLKIARIYLSVLEKDRREAIIALINNKKGFIRSELASRIRIKFTPELKFFLDDTLDYVEKIEGIIRKLHQNDNKKDEGFI